MSRPSWERIVERANIEAQAVSYSEAQTQASGAVAMAFLVRYGNFSDENVQAILRSAPTLRVMKSRIRTRFGLRPRWLRKLSKRGELQRQLYDCLTAQ